jgi:PelA/Pel-15E family pectate lyase
MAGMALVLAAPLAAATIGTMEPAAPLTRDRLANWPAAERKAWDGYLALSDRLRAADLAALKAERVGLPANPAAPADGPSGGGGLSLKHPAAWFAGPEAQRIADNIVSFQTPAGGWGKNQDRSGPPRQRGQSWVIGDHGSADAEASYVGTIDNNATIDEIRFLAAYQQAHPGPEGEPYRSALGRGLAYLIQMQMPNGGYPQVFPLQGGYHDAVTLNDDALAQVGELLRDAASGKGSFAKVSAQQRGAARACYDRLIALVLRAQIVAADKPAGWAQQYDTLALTPAGARNYEPISLSTGESAGVLVLLMDDPAPSTAMRRAIESGVAWLRATAIADTVWKKSEGGGVRRLISSPGAELLWPRYIDIVSGRAVFGDRDRTIHDIVTDLTPERQNSYSWYVTTPGKALKAYERWKGAKGK